MLQCTEKQLDQKNYIARVLNGKLLTSSLSLELGLGLVVNGMYFVHKLQKQVVRFLL